jgi:hypothetical protein
MMGKAEAFHRQSDGQRRDCADHRDLAVVLPKFDVMAVNELLGVFFGGVVVGADKLDCPEKTTFYPNNVCSISSHLTGPFPVRELPLYIIKSMNRLLGSRRENPKNC